MFCLSTKQLTCPLLWAPNYYHGNVGTGSFIKSPVDERHSQLSTLHLCLLAYRQREDLLFFIFLVTSSLSVCLTVSNFLNFSMTVDISVVNINEWLIMENISESLLTSKSQIYLWDKATAAFPFRVTIGYISYPDCFHLAYLHDNHVIKRATT